MIVSSPSVFGEAQVSAALAVSRLQNDLTSEPGSEHKKTENLRANEYRRGCLIRILGRCALGNEKQETANRH